MKFGKNMKNEFEIHISSYIDRMIEAWGNTLYFVYAEHEDYFKKYLEPQGFMCEFYHHNPYLADDPDSRINQQVDVIFDDVTLPNDGLIIHPKCEYTYPIGRVHEGQKFLLIGNDAQEDQWTKLYNCNPITSCDQLIDQNRLKEVYHTKKWSGGYEGYYLAWGSN